jgi:hypothetical protein
MMIREEEGRMAPLSILPGRIRFESKLLIGDIQACRRLETFLHGVHGVTEASANHRTGRITVRFDKSTADRISLEEQVKNALGSKETGPYPNSTHLSKEKAPAMPSSGMTGHAVIDMLARAFLPKPFNVLLPIAMHTIRR